MEDKHYYWMNEALEEAKKAYAENEIPVGAVLVADDRLVCRDHNRTRQLSDPTAHAEKLIIEAILAQGVKFLYDYTLYVTLEPCSMCAGMIILSRIGTIVTGADDPKTGAAGSLYNLLLDRQLNHNPKLIAGIAAAESSILLKKFFQEKRHG